MSESAASVRTRLRTWMRPLQATPFHPQWLVARQAASRRDWVSLHAKGVVLDIGCADKGVRRSLSLADDYIGLDYPPTSRVLYRTYPDVLGDAARLPFADGAVNTVLMLDLIEHLPRPELALAEARRVLTIDGQLIITVPFAYPLHDQPYDYQRFTVHGLTVRLRDAGFVYIEVNEVADAIDAAGSSLALALAQASINAVEARSWRILIVPLLLAAVPIVNLGARLLSLLAPTRKFMPAGYRVRASLASTS